jgi:hypothetical protein
MNPKIYLSNELLMLINYGGAIENISEFAGNRNSQRMRLLKTN